MTNHDYPWFRYLLPVIHGVDVLENVTVGVFEEDVSKKKEKTVARIAFQE